MNKDTFWLPLVCGIFRHKLLLPPYNGLFSRTTWESWYQIGKTSLDLNLTQEMTGFWDAVASDGPYANNLHLTSNGQPHKHLITQFLQAGCSSWRPTSSVKALKAVSGTTTSLSENASTQMHEYMHACTDGRITRK